MAEVCASLQWLRQRFEVAAGARSALLSRTSPLGDRTRRRGAASGSAAAPPPVVPLVVAKDGRPAAAPARGRVATRKTGQRGSRRRSTTPVRRQKCRKAKGQAAQTRCSLSKAGTAAASGPAITASPRAADPLLTASTVHSLGSASPGVGLRRAELALRFLRRAKRSYGTVALCLSGGAAIGNFHW